MENKEPTRLDNESLPSDEDDLQGVSSSPTCQSQSHDGSLGHPQLNKSKEIMGDLELGMEFSSKESAYDYYCNYARDKDFDVREHHWKKKNNAGVVTRVTYTCSRQGFRRNDEPVEGTTYTQPVSRVGCEAHMTCLLKKNGKFKIVSFDANQNHTLVRTPMKHMLKINRKMS
ncbi:hypothetical protein ACFX1Z_018555 [Malus domestica]